MFLVNVAVSRATSGSLWGCLLGAADPSVTNMLPIPKTVAARSIADSEGIRLRYLWVEGVAMAYIVSTARWWSHVGGGCVAAWRLNPLPLG